MTELGFNNEYAERLEAVVRILPILSDFPDYALKGGTAINLFYRNLPRLSIDIDLCYLPIQPRGETINQMDADLKRLKSNIEAKLGWNCKQTFAGKEALSKLQVESSLGLVIIEPNYILRGSVYSPVILRSCSELAELIGSEVEVQCMSKEDVYGGKICAALDRQHPRDLFDIRHLLDNEGITDHIRKAFVVYLASHSRPMNELLNPALLDIRDTFEKSFQGMTLLPVTIDDLVAARTQLLSVLKNSLTENEKGFLLSVKNADPDYSLMQIPAIENLPGLKWKVMNIKRMKPAQREQATDKLAAVLGL